jgi:hypothetical protein
VGAAANAALGGDPPPDLATAVEEAVKAMSRVVVHHPFTSGR